MAAAGRVRAAVWALAVWAVVSGCFFGAVDAAVRLDDTDMAQRPIGAHDSDVVDEASSPSTPPPPPVQRYTNRLNFSSSAPHLFASAYGLFQQWSNTVFPNGHTLAAATIPAYTLLYHGLQADAADAADASFEHAPARDESSSDNLSPASPEWVALDVEMAYGIMGSSRRSWLLTYQTTRAVRVLYVDGESAALMGLGQLDSQMLLLYGNVTGPAQRPGGFGLAAEYDRARGLCAWLANEGLRGRGWGYEGIVRMNAGFEVIWCDFLSDSLRLLSRLNVTAPLDPVETETAETADTRAIHAVSENTSTSEEDKQTDTASKDNNIADVDTPSYYPLPPVPTRSDPVVDPTNPPAPPNWRGGGGSGGGGGGGGRYGSPDGESGEEPFLTSQGWGWFESATWHYGSSRAGPGAGETRVQVDNCGIVSFYAPQFEAGGVDGLDLTLAKSRAVEEQQRLNLTTEGYWKETAVADDTNGRAVALRQLGRRRRFHHLGNASVDDALLMRRSAATALARTLETAEGGRASDKEAATTTTEVCTGAPWTLILAEIVQRMARHLKTVEAILLDGPHGGTVQHNRTELRAWLHRLRAQNHLFMVGYLEYPAAASASASSDGGVSSEWQPSSALFNRTLSLCRYRYTRLFADDQRQSPSRPSGGLPAEENDLRWAVEETYGTICGELLAIGFDVERVWAQRFGKGAAQGDGDARDAELAVAAGRWYDQLTELVAWLGWESEFIGCDRVCGWHERCFIPMWPLMSSQWGRGGGPGGGHGGGGGGGSGRRRPPPRWGRDPRGNNGTDNGPYGGGPGGRPGFGFPRSPAMMGDDTDLWEPKCVEAWYIMGRR
ncbi:MAG: hypothetical protein STHCBS139747_003141 [Sporothrix thermara]